MGEKLGKGAYAVVFKAEDKRSKKVLALKKIFDSLDDNQKFEFRKEIYANFFAAAPALLYRQLC